MTKPKKQYLLVLTEAEHLFLKTRAKMMELSIKEFLLLSAYTMVEKGLNK